MTGHLSDDEVSFFAEKYDVFHEVLENRLSQSIKEEEEYHKKPKEERVYLEAKDLPTSDKKPKKFSMHEAVSKDQEHRPGMTGVYHSPKGDAVATDVRVMVVSKKEYNPAHKGKVVDKKGKPVTQKIVEGRGKDKQVREVEWEGRYPDYERVIPKNEPQAKAEITDAAIQDACGVDVPKNEDVYVTIKFGKGNYAILHIQEWQRFLRAAKHIGATEIEFHGNGRPLAAKSEDGAVIVVTYGIGGVSDLATLATVYRQDLSATSGKKNGKTRFSVREGAKENSTNERQDLTTTIRSEMEDGAKIEISIEDAKQNLQELQKEFAGKTSPRGFIGAVSKAFGYPDGVHQQSFYFEITAPDGTPFTFRISNHNVNSNYADQREISVTVKSRRRENGFRGESWRTFENMYISKNLYKKMEIYSHPLQAI